MRGIVGLATTITTNTANNAKSILERMLAAHRQRVSGDEGTVVFLEGTGQTAALGNQRLAIIDLWPLVTCLCRTKAERSGLLLIVKVTISLSYLIGVLCSKWHCDLGR